MFRPMNRRLAKRILNRFHFKIEKKKTKSVIGIELFKKKNNIYTYECILKYGQKFTCVYF